MQPLFSKGLIMAKKEKEVEEKVMPEKVPYDFKAVLKEADGNVELAKVLAKEQGVPIEE